MKPLLSMTDVDAGYGSARVLRGINFDVRPAEVVVVLGANGAGKTTLLRVATGFVQPFAGSVETLDEPPKDPVKTARRGVAYVPEERGLFTDMNVHENLALGARGARRERKERIERALAYFPPLERLMRRQAGLLSGGEQQMLAVARALAGGPKLLLIDEMSQGLAPLIVEQMLPRMREVAADLGHGVVLVEQHVDLALEIADRAYVLSRGQVDIACDAADLIKDRSVLQRSYLGNVTDPEAATAT
ncbi:ABC transporter ATP-binding protein [Nocardia sp. CA-120079]|uniref:ABC transporter ATP-binding protein n=1 Tax=Nocardia sp. CA-120079 TaxID=3239974 RepID=UPI003D96F80B